MWVTSNNEIITETVPDSDGFIEINRPCPHCLGSGIDCKQCSGSGTLPTVLEKVLHVYEWAAENSLKLPFKSPEQTIIRNLLDRRLSTSRDGNGGFNSSLLKVLDKSNFPTMSQYRCLKPTEFQNSSSSNTPVRPFNAKIGAMLNLALTVRKVEVLTRKFSIESFSSLLLETNDHRHLIAYDTYPSGHSVGDAFCCNIQVVKRLWVNSMSILLVRMIKK